MGWIFAIFYYIKNRWLLEWDRAGSWAAFVSVPLITLLKRWQTILNYKKATYLEVLAMRDKPPVLFKTCNASRGLSIFKSLKRINYCRCNRSSEACNTRHIFSLQLARIWIFCCAEGNIIETDIHNTTDIHLLDPFLMCLLLKTKIS